MNIPHRLVAAVLATAAFATAGVANAVTPDDDIVIGAGMYDDSCDLWTAARAANRDNRRKVDEYMLISWMQGYLSGANLTNTYTDPSLAVALPSAARLSEWLDKACKDEPRTPVFLLADKLMKSLQKRPRK